MWAAAVTVTGVDRQSGLTVVARVGTGLVVAGTMLLALTYRMEILTYRWLCS